MNENDYGQLLADVKDWLTKHSSATKAVNRRADATEVDFRGSRAEWTNALLNALADIARKRGLVPFPARLYFSRDQHGKGQGHNSAFDRPTPQKDDRGEFMADMTWWNQGDDKEFSWWKKPLEKLLVCELAVESEWGWYENQNLDYHFEQIFLDYNKLLILRAEGRLLLTSCPPNHIKELKEKLSLLRARAGLEEGEVCVWLWDWDAKWENISEPEVIFP